jgi:hypothetical protein
MPSVHSSPRACRARESVGFLIKLTAPVPGIRYLSLRRPPASEVKSIAAVGKMSGAGCSHYPLPHKGCCRRAISTQVRAAARNQRPLP